MTKLKEILNKTPVWLKASVLLIACIMLMTYAASSMNALKDYHPDNIGEEALEEVIEHYTGIEADLSPMSYE